LNIRYKVEPTTIGQDPHHADRWIGSVRANHPFGGADGVVLGEPA
jgi:hypothetical protein